MLLEKPAAVIRYLDFDGDDLPLVFIHGLGCAGSSHFPRLLAEPVIADRRRVVIDLFGHGYSDRPEDFGYTLEEHTDTVTELLDPLDLRGCVVFGHSMGGSIAITIRPTRMALPKLREGHAMRVYLTVSFRPTVGEALMLSPVVNFHLRLPLGFSAYSVPSHEPT